MENDPIKALEKKMKDMEIARVDSEKTFKNEIQRLQNSVKTCKNEIQRFQNKWSDTDKTLQTYMAKTNKLEESRNRLVLGELCAKCTEGVYWDVAPEYFYDENKKIKKDYKQPRFDKMDQNIKQLYENRNEQKQAQRKWDAMKDRIGLDLVRFVTRKMDERNKEAHPFPLEEKELMEIAEQLPGVEERLCKQVIQLTKKTYPAAFDSDVRPKTWV